VELAKKWKVCVSKMAVVVSSSETRAPSISDLTIVNSDFKCIDTSNDSSRLEPSCENVVMLLCLEP